MKVSVIIPSYNASSTIEACLDSLLPQIDGPQNQAEILVVDSSWDETPIILQHYCPLVKVIRLKQQTPPGTARNLAIRRAHGDILVSIDADCVVPPDFLQQVVRAHQANDALAIGGVILNGHSESLTSWAEYFASSSAYLEGTPRQVMHTIPTCNISYKRDTFVKYGGFSPASRGEDVLFHHRLTQAGETLLFEPTIKVFHLYRTNLSQLLRRQMEYTRVRYQLRMVDPLSKWRLFYSPPLFLMYPFVKLLLIVTRILRCNRGLIPIFLQSLPQLVLVLLATAFGMLMSSLSLLRRRMCFRERTG